MQPALTAADARLLRGLLRGLLPACRLRRGARGTGGAFELVEGREAGEARGVAQVFLDAEELVVLGDAVCARERARLDLAGVGGDREVGDEGVLGLARAVRDDDRAAVRA